MNWFLSLSRKDLVQFIHELKEIWHYRADMTTQTKRNICPDTRGPFRNLNMQYMITEQNSWNVKKVVLEVMEQFVFTGIDGIYLFFLTASLPTTQEKPLTTTN